MLPATGAAIRQLLGEMQLAGQTAIMARNRRRDMTLAEEEEGE